MKRSLFRLHFFAFRKKAKKMVGRWAVEKNFLIMSDEVYEKLAFDEENPHISIGSLSEEINDHVITIDSFSKSYTMTGWRVGFLTAPKWLSAKIDALQTHLAANATTFAQFGALKALQEGDEVCRMMKNSFAKRRDEAVRSVLSTI